MVKIELCIYNVLLTLISPSGSSELLCPRSLLFFFSFSFLHPAWKHRARLAGIANCSFHPSDLVAFGVIQEGLLVAVYGVRGIASLSLQHLCSPSFCPSPRRTQFCWLGDPSGRGGAPLPRCHAQHLRDDSQEHRALHLRQRRHQEGHCLPLVWRLSQEVGRKKSFQCHQHLVTCRGVLALK